MWTAFPSSDYYGNSVTLGLASRRPSRASATKYELAWVRQSTHLLLGLIVRWHSSRNYGDPVVISPYELSPLLVAVAVGPMETS